MGISVDQLPDLGPRPPTETRNAMAATALVEMPSRRLPLDRSFEEHDRANRKLRYKRHPQASGHWTALVSVIMMRLRLDTMLPRIWSARWPSLSLDERKRARTRVTDVTFSH